MPRRDITPGREEIEYRLLNILRQLPNLNGTQVKAALAAVAGLSKLWDIPLGDSFWEIARSFSKFKNPNKVQGIPEEKKPEADTPQIVDPQVVKPIAPENLFDGLEDDDGEED